MHIKHTNAIAVLGLGITGQGTVKFLAQKYSCVYVWDDHNTKRDTFSSSYKHIILTPFNGQLYEKIQFLVVSPSIPDTHPILKHAKEYGVTLLTDIDVFFLFFPSCKVIGVTGTVGKTSTVMLLAHVLKHSGYTVEVAGNVGRAVLSLPDNTKKNHIYIFELSSYQLHRLKYARFWMGILLNIYPHHLTFHKTLALYAQAKHHLFSFSTHKILPSTENKHYDNALYFSLHPLNHAGVYLEKNCVYDTEMNTSYTVSLQNIPPYLTKESLLVLYLVVKKLSLSFNQAKPFLYTFPQVPHRQEPVPSSKKGITIINDSKATMPRATMYALQRFSRDKEKIIWIVGGKNENNYINAQDILSHRAHIVHVLCTGESGHVYSQILSSFPCTQVESLQDACKLIPNLLNVTLANIILFSPAAASFDAFKNFEDRGNAFKQYILEALG